MKRRDGFGRVVSRILSPLLNGENHLSAQPIPETRFAFAKPGAGRSGASYLALHPMGFSVPRRLRFARCALTAPFHHHPGSRRGCLFSVALSVRRFVSRPRVSLLSLTSKGYAASRPVVFGLSSRLFNGQAILCPSKTADKLPEN
jgi:hypothetical protein